MGSGNRLHFIVALLVVMTGGVVAVTAVCSKTPDHLSNAPVLKHIIDEKAWLYPDIISWPGEEKAVYIIFNADSDARFCGRKLTSDYMERIKHSQMPFVLFSESCEKLVVLVGKRKSVDQQNFALVAAHEAFHEAVEYSGIKPRLDMIDLPENLQKRQAKALEIFLHELITTLRSDHEDKVVCKLFKNEFYTLDEITQYYLLHKAYWEWPAEHYMRTASMKGSSFSDYMEVRQVFSPKSGGRALYIAGAAVFEDIENIIERAEWQDRYVHGDTPVDILMDAHHCEPIQGSYLQVSMQLPDIFE